MLSKLIIAFLPRSKHLLISFSDVPQFIYPSPTIYHLGLLGCFQVLAVMPMGGDELKVFLLCHLGHLPLEVLTIMNKASMDSHMQVFVWT